MRRVVPLAALLVALGSTPAPAGPEDVPASLAPLDYLVGGWKGSGVPAANRVKGWSESHAWAWKFRKGTPVGLTATFVGDKTLASADLTFDEAKKLFTLAGTTPEGKPATYTGALDKAGKTLTLNRVGGEAERITLRPNSEKIRYTMSIDRKAAGAPSYSKFVEVGLTKDGESFAASSTATEAPKCIITGGAANATVSFEGKTYPICCSGCRDEFNDDPAKYVAKALQKAQAGGKGESKTPPKSKSVGKDDGGFDDPK